MDSVTTWNTLQVDKAGLDEALLALEGSEDLLSEAVTGVCHGERGGTSTILGLDNLVTTKLYTLDQVGHLLVWDAHGGLSLAEERDNGLSGVTTNDWDGGLGRLLVSDNLGDEGLGTNDIEGGDTEEALCVEDTLGLQDLGGNWDGGVDRVGDDQDVSLRCNLGDNLDEALDDAGVDVEKIITGHARFSWDTSRNDDDVRILECLLGTVILREVAGDFLIIVSAYSPQSI